MNLERYEAIKNVLKENKISSKELDKYIAVKNLRHLRYRGENEFTDEEIFNQINETDKGEK